MKVMSRFDTEHNKTHINIVLKNEEIERLKDGKVVSIDDQDIQVQIVGYGDE